MNQVQHFKKQVLDRRDLLFKHFGLIRKYPVHTKISLEALESERVDTSPHDHTISSEVDLSDDYMFIYAVELEEFGVLPDGEDVSAETLTFETDDFSLRLKLSHLFRHNRVITLQGLLQGGTSLELIHLQSGVICSVWGLSRKDMPDEFYKETISEALCFELDGRLKQGFFLYMTAIDSLIGFSLRDLTKFKELREHITFMKLEDKLSLSLRRFIDREDIDNLPLTSYLKRIFFECLEYRNDIAHSAKSVTIKETTVEKAAFLILVLQMIRETRTADLEKLKTHFDFATKVNENQRMPRI